MMRIPYFKKIRMYGMFIFIQGTCTVVELYRIDLLNVAVSFIHSWRIGLVTVTR